jgi:hypothetical protein
MEVANELNFQQGEIAIKHGDNGKSELYVLSNDKQTIDTFVSKAYVDSMLFVGTQEQYDEAYKNGKISVGAIVIITEKDINVQNGGPTSALLGEGVLGEMILGKE